MTEKITINDFAKLDIRTGKILKAEDIEGADKLYKLEVDIGTEKRIVVAGIKQNYTKEQLKNKRCIILANLEPRKMKGIESNGMILASVNEDESQVILIQPEKDIELGSKVR